MRLKSFLWQHLLLLISLFVMTAGVALCVRSALGCSVISVLPYLFANAGGTSSIPQLTIGEWTYVMNAILVVAQILILRRRFQPAQLAQLIIGFAFGALLDLNMALTSWLAPTEFWSKALAQVGGCAILGVGIAFEVRCGSVTMPGEGLPVAISQVTGIHFAKVKIGVDIALVTLGIAACYILFGAWQWHVVGIGTLFAMIFVGAVVRFISPRIAWFDRLLTSPRVIVGLAKHLPHHIKNIKP